MISIPYTLDRTLDEPAGTTGSGRISLNPSIPPEYRDIIAFHEREEYVEVISHNPAVLQTAPDGSVFVDKYLFPKVQRDAHEESCKGELALAEWRGMRKEYLQWRVRMLTDEMIKAQNEGRLTPELEEMFLEDRRLFLRN